ncbi:ABC transporter substrate-binding protein [Desulfoluna sp.]|uniref:ABC transporter substrate-binding protein n=1 Tax=Desulfoluna sp. TaxID=2045199 RepID=UPI00262470BC|nr:ABC transporter substrate-binding protein [Desulfoluna sp.]
MKNIGTLLLAAVTALLVTAGGASASSGGTFVFCAPYGGDLFSLDMHKTSRTQDYIVGLNINRSLYKWDADQSKPVLALATDVKISADRKVYTFSLRNNVKFHNGRTMTADDVIWSYNRIAQPETSSSAASYIANIEGADAVMTGKTKTISGLKKIDDFTLEMTLKHPVDIGYALCKVEAAIVPREAIEGREAEFSINPVGCGPFKFVKWVRGSEVILEKFDGYFEAGKPYIDKLVYKIMPEGAARDIAFRSGELDANIVGASQYPIYLRDPQIKDNMIEVAEMYTRLIGFNSEFKPFADLRVRKAINHAINAELIIRKLLKNKAVLATGFLPTSSPAYDTAMKGYEYNLTKAKALMKEAGYADGFTFECIATANKSWGVGIVEALIPFLKRINITIKPQQLEGAALGERCRTGKFDAFIWSNESGPDPLETLNRYRSTTPRSAGNYTAYANPKYDKALDMAATAKTPAEKLEWVKKANRILFEDAPFWFFNYNKAIIAYQPWVKGIKPVAIEMMLQDFTNVTIDDSSPRK